MSKCYITHIHTQQRLWKSQQSKTVIMGHDNSFFKPIKTLKLIWSKALRQPWLYWHQSWCRLNGWFLTMQMEAQGLFSELGFINRGHSGPSCHPLLSSEQAFPFTSRAKAKGHKDPFPYVNKDQFQMLRVGPSLPCPLCLIEEHWGTQWTLSVTGPSKYQK